MLKNVCEGLNVKNVYEDLNAHSEVYLSDLLSSTASKFISTQARPIFAKTTILSRPLFSGPKTVQASVTLLEQLPTFLEKSYR